MKVVAGVWLVALAVAGASTQERFDVKVRSDFFAGFAGNREALLRGMKACEEVLAREPTHAEALVWHGGGLHFLAGELFQRGEMARGAELAGRGLAEMDRAVELAPTTVAIRIPRGAYLLAASRFGPAEMRRAMIELSLIHI